MVAIKHARDGIIKYIKDKKLRVGDKLPPESIFTEYLDVSKSTLRESLKLLKGEGIVNTMHGKGTFISSDITHINDTIDNNLSITEMIIAAGYKPGVNFFQRNLVKANSEVAKNLHIPEGSDVLVCKRVRTADGKPVVYSIDYFTPHLVPGFLRVEDKNVSIFNYIEKDSKIKIENGFAELVPFKCTKDLSKKLDYPIDGLLFLIKQSTIDSTGNPLIYAVEYLRPDCFRIFVNRKRR